MSTDQEISDVSEPLAPSPEPVMTGKTKGGSAQFSAFVSQFELEPKSEDKIRLSLDFMRSALSGSGVPRFRDFWEGRRLCLPLFKENLPVKNRTQLWADYIELSSEARRVKEILDEQSAFAVEQIELAIQALERDLEHQDAHLAHIPPLEFPKALVALKNKHSFYDTVQRELHLLNTLAARINGLRKEIIKTEMRIRIKNKLFERLSVCGDRVFPRRKELIKTISDAFISDVEDFVASQFGNSASLDIPLYALREEIKALQSVAKELTLNTQAFTETRQRLSGCWDQVKSQEKERKKEFAEKRQVFKQNCDLAMEKITVFATLCAGELSLDEANAQAREILDFMKSIELGRDEVNQLREAIRAAKQPIVEKAHAREQERLAKENRVEIEKREKLQAFKQRLQSLLAAAGEFDLDLLIQQRDELHAELETLTLSKAEKQIADRSFKQMKDLINEKKERALMDLSEDDLKSLEQLKVMLDERKERRQEIKDQLEVYRKALGGSGFDFEKAMMYREMIEAEKTALDKINTSIDEIEEKIDQIEG